MSDTKMKKAMMKNLIFCLLLLTGAGMLNSCQQDEIVNEAPASKGVTIRASLPNDAQSRVTLGDTYTSDGKNYTKMCWEKDDEITLTISSDGDEPQTHTFNISGDYSNSNPSNRADFTCDDDIAIDPSKTYTFTYGQEPTAGNAQAGTIDGLKENLYMTASYTAQNGDTWDNVSLTFRTQVALVELTLPNNIGVAKVSLYNADNNSCLAFMNQSKTLENNKVYFAIPPGTYNGLVVAETSNGVYMKNLGNGTLSAGTLCRVTDSNGETKTGTQIPDSNVKYYVDNGTLYVYGSGAIPEKAFYQKNPISPTSVIILEGITGIGNKAFYECNSLADVTIPASVESIGDAAFKLCANGCIVKVMRNNPPTLGTNNVFGNVQNNQYQIKVPSGSVNTYKSAAGWKDYKDIIQAIQ